MNESFLTESFLTDDNTVKALFELTGFKVERTWELANRYWPRDERHALLCVTQPWWMVETQFGPIVVGPRKQVFVIDWFHTKFRGLVTEPDETVTSDRTTVHAWDSAEFLKFLRRLAQKMAETKS